MADPVVPVRQIWFHCVVSTDPRPCAIATKLQVDDLPVRVLSLGGGSLTTHPWGLYPHLFLGDVGIPVVNVVCAPLRLHQGTEMKTEKGETVYRPVTAFAGLWMLDSFNVAIIYPFEKRRLEEEPALEKYDLRIVLAEQDKEKDFIVCRRVDDISEAIRKGREQCTKIS